MFYWTRLPHILAFCFFLLVSPVLPGRDTGYLMARTPEITLGLWDLEFCTACTANCYYNPPPPPPQKQLMRKAPPCFTQQHGTTYSSGRCPSSPAFPCYTSSAFTANPRKDQRRNGELIKSILRFFKVN